MTTATATSMAKKQQAKISIVFDFSWDDCNTQEKLARNHGYAKFWWVNKVKMVNEHCDEQ